MDETPIRPASPDVRNRMRTQPRRDTAPELLLRRELWRRGRRYRVDYPLPMSRRRRMDLAFVGARVAVLVDGCFWHGCPIHASAPTNNAAWWRDKLRVNVERDRDTDRLLTTAGWTVVRVWEHEVLTNVAAAADRVDAALVGPPGTDVSRPSGPPPGPETCHT